MATTFLGQIEFILRYGASLTMTPTSQGWIDSLLKTPITPWNWVTYYSPIGYLITNVTVSGSTGSYSYVSAGYYGVTNQFEVWLVYLWGAYTAYLWWKTRGATFASESDAKEFRLARFALIWFLVVFLGYLFLFYYGRITYPYYFISAVPSLAIGGVLPTDQELVPPAGGLHLPRGRLPLVLHLLSGQELPPHPSEGLPRPLSPVVHERVNPGADCEGFSTSPRHHAQTP